jgi:hypothetical protein
MRDWRRVTNHKNVYRERYASLEALLRACRLSGTVLGTILPGVNNSTQARNALSGACFGEIARCGRSFFRLK